MSKRLLFFLCVAIFFVSIGFSFYADISPHADAKAYNHIGWNLARGIGYIENEELANPYDDDAIFRIGPGYEFFLAGIYRVAGIFLEKGDAYAPYAERPYPLKFPWQMVWIAHAFLRALTALLLFKIALLVFPDHQKKEWIGFSAAAIFGFFPDLILINGFLLYETLLLFWGVAAIYFSLKTISNPLYTIHYTLYASLSWSLAVLTRPSELLSFLVFPAVLVWQKNWRAALVSFLFPLLLVGGWSLRNSLFYGQPLFTTTAGAYALWVGNNENANGEYDRPAELKEARSALHSTELSSLSMRHVAQFIRDDPLKFIGLQIRKTMIYFSLIRPTGFWPEFENTPGKRLAIVVSSALATALLFILSANGMWLLWEKREYLFLVLFWFVAAKPLAIIPLYVETRYRYSIYPLLAFFAAFALIEFFTSSFRTRHIKTWGIALLAFFCITIIDAAYVFDKVIAHIPLLLSF